MNILAIDLGKFNSMCCFYDTDTQDYRFQAVSIQYNAWAKTTYERIHGGQKTRKKKAAIALARKIAVVAWAMLKNETDWDPEKAGINLQSAVEVGPSKSDRPL